MEWDPLFTVLFICEMDTLQLRTNWYPLTTSHPTKWNPLNVFYNFSQDQLIKIPPIGMGPIFHHDIRLLNGPTAKQQQLGPTYLTPYEMGPIFIFFHRTHL